MYLTREQFKPVYKILDGTERSDPDVYKNTSHIQDSVFYFLSVPGSSIF